MVDQKKEYVKAAGLTDEICMQLIKGYLEKFDESKASEITKAVEDALPGQLNKMQKSRKVSNILQKMKKNGIADTKGKGAGALWFSQFRLFKLRKIGCEKELLHLQV